MTSRREVKNWCFTNFDILENKNRGNVTNVLWYKHPEISYIIAAVEKGDLTEHPHHQGYLQLKTRRRMSWLKSNFSKSVHWSIQESKKDDNAIDYCKKGMQSKDEWKQSRTNGPNYGKNLNIYCENGFISIQGQSYDLTKAISDIKAGNIDDVKMSIAYIKHGSNLDNQMKYYQNKLLYDEAEKEFDAEFKNMNIHQKFWYQKQQEIGKMCFAVIQKAGNLGKSMFGKYLKFKHNGMVFNNSSERDIAAAYDGRKNVIFDFARAVKDNIPYECFENMLEGQLFSPKYQGTPLSFPRPNIFVGTNSRLDYSKLSHWKWYVLTYDGDKLYSIFDGRKTKDPKRILDCMYFVQPDDQYDDFLDNNIEQYLIAEDIPLQFELQDLLEIEDNIVSI